MFKFSFKKFRDTVSSELLKKADDCGTSEEFQALMNKNGFHLRDFFEEEQQQMAFEPIDPDIEEDLFCTPWNCFHEAVSA